ncbi:MAG: fatty acyl-AMP ligase [Myxococcota bacterium]
MVEVRPTLTEELAVAARSGAGISFLDKQERSTRLSYQELASRAERTAAGLFRLGIRAQDRVAIILPTCPEFFDAFFGLLRLGAIPVPLYPPVRMGRMDEYHQRTALMLRHVEAALILTDARIRRILGRTVEQFTPRLGCRLVSDLGADPAILEGLAGPEADTPALIQFSSGSTAHPKPVLLSHRQILANVKAIVEAIDTAFPEAEGVVHAGASWLPLYHDMGLIGCVFPAINGPRELSLIPPELFLSRPGVWLRTISRAKATVSPAPNFAYGLCADRVRDEELVGVDLSSWRMALNGAEPVSPETLERFIARFRPYGLRPEALTPVYGLSEAALAVTFSPPRRPFQTRRFSAERLAKEGIATEESEGRALVSLGAPLPGFELWIADEEGAPLPAGRVGRVLVRGPSIMSGYYGQPEATAAALTEGKLDTGDIGFLHEGELYLVGRKKDLLIVRGRKYAPQEIEQLLDAVPGVRTGCAAALGFQAAGSDTERVVVLVERKGPGPLDDPELLGALRGRIAEGSGIAVDEIHLLAPGTLPRTSSGKIRRREALSRWLEGSLAPPTRVTPIALAHELVRSAAAFMRSARGG